MKDHLFYFGLMIALIIGFAAFAPGNSITGFTIQECPECGKLCDLDDECGGIICCPTAWESGVCHQAQSCAAIAQVSMDMSYEEYFRESPQSFRNIAWKTFALPVILIVGLVALVVYLSRKSR